MERSEIFETVKRLLIEQIKQMPEGAAERIADSDDVIIQSSGEHLVGNENLGGKICLGADSIDVAELLLGCEEIYDLDIPHEEAAELRTVKAAVDYLESTLTRPQDVVQN